MFLGPSLLKGPVQLFTFCKNCPLQASINDPLPVFYAIALAIFQESKEEECIIKMFQKNVAKRDHIQRLNIKNDQKPQLLLTTLSRNWFRFVYCKSILKMILAILWNILFSYPRAPRAPQVPILVPPKTPKMGHFGYFGGTENGTSGARIKILRPLFNTNTPPKTPI